MEGLAFQSPKTDPQSLYWSIKRKADVLNKYKWFTFIGPNRCRIGSIIPMVHYFTIICLSFWAIFEKVFPRLIMHLKTEWQHTEKQFHA